MEQDAGPVNQEESLLAEVFNQCDRDGSGYITRDELAELCKSRGEHHGGGEGGGAFSPGRLDSLMESLDLDKDGHISFEEFKAGFQAYCASQLGGGGSHDDHVTDTANSCSTPKHILVDEEVYESAVGSEFDWNETADRVDPEGVLHGMGVEKVWEELATKDPSMLEQFENFLSEVVLQMQHSQEDKQKLQNHIKRIMAQHSREVSEMDQILHEQLLQAKEDSQQKSANTSRRISTHFTSLLAEREAHIEKLEEKETSLQQTLVGKVTSESELKQERKFLLSMNEELRQQLSSPNPPSPLVGQSKPLEQSQDHLVQEWVEPSTDDAIKFYPSVRSPVQRTESADSAKEGTAENQANTIDKELAQREDKSDMTDKELVPGQDRTNQIDEDSATGKGSVHKSEGDSEEGADEKNQSDEDSARGRYMEVRSDEDSGQGEDKTNRSDEDSALGSPTEEKTIRIDERRLMERPRPVGEDISLSTSQEEAPLIPPSNSSLVNRVFKVAFLGDSGVGKSSLILRLCEGRFNSSCVSTLGLDFSTKLLTVGDERVVFQLWDTAGQERFRNALTPVYLRRADAFVIVYDVTSKKSFKSSKSWLSIISAALREQPPVVMLVGNKTDRLDKREVTSEDGRLLALELHALFSEMSALSGDNVLQAHTTLAQLLLTRENEHLEKVKNEALQITSSQNKKKCSC